jgi:RimJ/RimL family protein N-acetyltransferase
MPRPPLLRDVIEDDLPIFFDHQMESEASSMAAFTAKDPTDWARFLTHWDRMRADATVVARTIVVDGQTVGHVMTYEEGGRCEVTYWLGKEHWGKGIATQALAAFLAHTNKTRPIHARAAKDNIGSRRVLEKCGFAMVGEAKGFANARGKEIEELLLELRA